MAGGDDASFTGAVLAEGLPLPLLNPGQAMLLEFTAVAELMAESSEVEVVVAAPRAPCSST